MGIILLAALIIAAVIYVTPYRRARILGFLDQSADTQGQNYQVNQALIAIGSGGLWGVGYGQSTTKANLPAVIDDSIFAVIGEELGFVGTATLIVLFCLFALRLFWDARRVGDRFGSLLLIGIGTVVSVQAFVNIASTAGAIPLTGVPLALRELWRHGACGISYHERHRGERDQEFVRSPGSGYGKIRREMVIGEFWFVFRDSVLK